MKYGSKKHIDFNTLLHESLLKSLWKVWKSWKNRFFAIIRKVIFSKVLNIWCWLFRQGVTHPWSFFETEYHHPSHHNAKTPHVERQLLPFSRFWSVFDIHGTKYCHLGNTCWPNFFGVIIMAQSHPLPNIMVVSTLEQKIFHFKGCCD